MSERDPWLTEREAAEELRVSTYIVKMERAAGRLKCTRIRRRVFYPMSMINAYKASLLCPEKSTFGSIPTATDGTSPGPKEHGPTAYQRARATVERLKSTGRLSS